MRFKKGDLLTCKGLEVQKPVVRVTKVTRDGVVHCVNLVDCATMKAGHEFHFTPDERTRFVVYSE